LNRREEVWNRREEAQITRTGSDNQIGKAQSGSSSRAPTCCKGAIAAKSRFIATESAAT